MSILAAACTASPATPTLTLSPLRVVVLTYTPSPSPRPTVTLWPSATLVVQPTATLEPSPTPPPAQLAAAAQPPAQLAAAAQPPAQPAAVVQPPPPAAAAPVVAWAPPPAGDVAASEQYTIDLINARRAEAGAAPLARDETLMGIARARVADMVARNYTGHDDPVTGESLGRSWMRAAGFTSNYLGENWYGSIHTPPGIVDIAMSWFMTDPPHARNILSSNYAYVGVGIAYNGRQWLLVQNFAGFNP